MSRRDAEARHMARHARDRLQSTLGNGAGLLTDGDGQVFEYDGGAHPRGGADPNADGPDPPGAVPVGPSLRWRVSLPVALFIAVVAVLGGAWFWMQVAAGQPEVLPLSEVSAQESSTADAEETPKKSGKAVPPANGPPQGGTVTVHVAGAVTAPGVVQLPAGSRVHEAIAEAGGGTPSADLDRLNLAAVLEDGQKLYVPVPGEDLPTDSGGLAGSEGGRPGGGDAAPAGGGKVNLNTASVEELDALPKVGPVLAQRIVDWRKEHGLFTSVEELDAVDGVGPKMLETLLPLVGV